MEVIYLKNKEDIKSDIVDLGLVLGYFDGVHIGHSQLISFAKSNTKKGSLGVLTFDRALKSVEGSLMALEDKIEAFARLGVDYCFIIVCDDNFKHMSYKKFVSQVLETFNPSSIFCGLDFKYGYGAEGDVDYLKQKFKNVYVIGYVKDHFGEKISSSLIKKQIKEGSITEANRHLGYPYTIKGAVIHGFKEGTKLGFPTANILPEISYVLPPNGVYYTRTIIDGIKYDSITNIGVHPTINETNSINIETHIIDAKFDSLYGYTIATQFYQKARGEIKFNSESDLKEEIAKDVANAKDFFRYRAQK